MNKIRLATIVIVIGVAAILSASLPLTQVQADDDCHQDHRQTTKTNTKKSVNTRALNLERQRARAKTSRFKKKSVSAKTLSFNKTLSLNMIHSRELPIAVLSIDKAAKAIESGNKKTVLAELDKTLNTLIAIYKALGTHVKPQFGNNRCPIMGSPIDPAKVTKNLIRDYMDQKVAFCCAGCLSTWDKLTDIQRQAKLSKMKHSMMAETLNLEKIHTENLPIVMLSVDKAAKVIESGDKKTALTEVHKAQNMLMAIQGALGKHVKPQFVNNRCPIMDSPINPAKVTKNLVRDYMGQKVAFCCAGCPSMWDKLINAQKQVKLAKAKPTL
ncbi:MAG: hypothetical protein ACYSU4_16045 [Planctomycetota bacterium]|jgi:hypothetical protein